MELVMNAIDNLYKDIYWCHLKATPDEMSLAVWDNLVDYFEIIEFNAFRQRMHHNIKFKLNMECNNAIYM
jgi:hypothetical protein